MNKFLTIGEVASRSGVATSALRFYETKGLITSIRNNSNQRRFDRSTIRRVSVIRFAQKLGLSLEEIVDAFNSLPDKRTPTKNDWKKLSKKWQQKLDQRIQHLQSLRDNLDSCIGCGCLSFKVCSIYNENDKAAAEGPGPRHLLRK